MKVVLIFIATFMALGFSFFVPVARNSYDEWKAPLEADKLINPIKGNISGTEEGKKLYVQMCSVCHGDKGKGDGVAGISLNPLPRNFTGKKVQDQTDGALFWKMTEGRPPMASYKSILSETQRWQLVNYLRTFNTAKK